MATKKRVTKPAGEDEQGQLVPLEVPASFVEFCDKYRTAETQLEPGQRAMCAVLFDNLDPIDLPDDHPAFGDVRAIGLRMFGCERIGDEAKRAKTRAAVCGRRGGKTSILAWRLAHLALTSQAKGMPGEPLYVLIVAPDEQLGKQTMAFAEGCIRTVRDSLVTQASATQFTITRPGTDQSIIFIVRPASGGGKATRGRTYLCALMEECAFFRDSESVVNDRDVFDSVMPGIVTGGQMLVPSTPWAKAGLLFELYEQNWPHPSSAIVAHAPTWEMRVNPDVLAQVAAEKERDEWNWQREYGAQFLTRDVGKFFETEALDACTEAA